MKLPRKTMAALFLTAIFQHPSPLIADTVLPHKFEFTEGKEHYYMLAVLDSSDETQLKGFQVFDAQNDLIQFIDFEEDLSHKVPEFIRGEIPDTQPVHFEDCNFDGFADAMFNEEISPRYQSFEIMALESQRKEIRF